MMPRGRALGAAARGGTPPAPVPPEIAEYLEALPAEQREPLERLRVLILSLVPDAEEAIRTNVPAVRYAGKTVVGYGAAAQHLSLYVMQGDALTELEHALAPYESTSRVIRFTAEFASIIASRRRAGLRRASLLAIAVLSAACAEEQGEPEVVVDAVTEPPVIEVGAGDYFYEMADTISAGVITLQLTTSGQELHHLQLVKLAEGKTAEDLFAEMRGDAAPAWATLVGGPNAPVPVAASSRVTLPLEAGNYVALCLIPSPDGTLHVAKGMSKAIVVAPGSPTASAPTANVKMQLNDYDFVLDQPLKAGRSVLEVTNTTAQPHEVFIARLEPGKTPMDLVAWIGKPEGPPPGTPMGGTVGISQGYTNFVHLDLEPGEYGLFCFLPDAGDGRPHFLHGMIRQITVL